MLKSALVDATFEKLTVAELLFVSVTFITLDRPTVTLPKPSEFGFAATCALAAPPLSKIPHNTASAVAQAPRLRRGLAPLRLPLSMFQKEKYFGLWILITSHSVCANPTRDY
jgi:hypothetical protein